MPPNNPPYTYPQRAKLKGGVRIYWRYRRNGLNIGLPGQPGDPEFHTRYAELQARSDRIEAQPAQPAAHTFAALCTKYLASAEFKALAARTREDYESTIVKRLVPVLGEERFDCITRPVVKALRDAHAARPRTAHKVKQMISRIYSWADECDLLPPNFINPGMGIRRLKARSKPIPIWSDDELAHFLTHARGQVVTAVLLAAHTGQRREDLVQLTWADYHGGTIRVSQNKTGEPLDIPCHRVLRDHLDSIRTGFGGPILRGAKGRPMSAGGLTQLLLRELAHIPEMPHRTWHGLRYLSAGRMEEAGCTVMEIVSIIGHRTYTMAIKYIRQRPANTRAVLVEYRFRLLAD